MEDGRLKMADCRLEIADCRWQIADEQMNRWEIDELAGT
jgi:hypothetical protein